MALSSRIIVAEVIDEGSINLHGSYMAEITENGTRGSFLC